ncbi:unnamed protein product [Closterium sp. NIES-53]
MGRGGGETGSTADAECSFELRPATVTDYEHYVSFFPELSVPASLLLPFDTWQRDLAPSTYFLVETPGAKAPRSDAQGNGTSDGPPLAYVYVETLQDSAFIRQLVVHRGAHFFLLPLSSPPPSPPLPFATFLPLPALAPPPFPFLHLPPDPSTLPNTREAQAGHGDGADAGSSGEAGRSRVQAVAPQRLPLQHRRRPPLLPPRPLASSFRLLPFDSLENSLSAFSEVPCTV